MVYMKNKLFKSKKGAVSGPVKGFLLLIILAIITSAVWISQMDTVYGQVYQGLGSHNFTYLNGTTSVTTASPQPFVSPSLLVQILGLIPLGLWAGVGFAGFKMFKA